MSKYPVFFPPDLGLDVDDFVAAWNEDAACSEAAKAKAEHDPSRFDGGLTAILSAIAAGVATTLISELVKATIKKLLKSEKKSKRIDVEVRAVAGKQALVVSLRDV